MSRVVAIAALIGILATFVLIQQLSHPMNSPVDGPSETQGASLLFSPLFSFLATTAFALSFASGILGMVMAGQSRQRIWFAILLVAVVVETYAGIAIITIPALTQFVFAAGPFQDLSSSANDPFLRLEMMNYVIAPLLAPLAALIYSLRAQGSTWSPVNAKEPDHNSDPVELEYSRLDDAPRG